MFVKWQKRRSTGDYYQAHGENAGWHFDMDTGWQRHAGDLLMASAVESKRVDGKPRHQLITYLGSIRENFAQGDARNIVRQDDFWRAVAVNLKKSGNRITKDDRAKIEAALSKRVDHPVQAEVDQLLADAKEKLEAYRNIKGQQTDPNPTERRVRRRAASMARNS